MYDRAQSAFGRGINPPLFVRGRCAGGNANGTIFMELQPSRPPSAQPTLRVTPAVGSLRPHSAPVRRDAAFLGKAGAVPVRIQALRPATKFSADADRFFTQKTVSSARRREIPGETWPDFSECRHMAHVGNSWNGDPFYKADNPLLAARRYKALVPTRIYGPRR